MFWGAITDLLIALKPDFFQIDPLAGETAISPVADLIESHLQIAWSWGQQIRFVNWIAEE